MSDLNDTGFEGWAIVELFGHKRLAGLVGSQQIAGGSLVRLDVPETLPRDENDRPRTEPYTKLIGLAAIYGITPTTEEVARLAAREIEKWNDPLPISLPRLTSGTTEPVAVGVPDDWQSTDDADDDLPM